MHSKKMDWSLRKLETTAARGCGGGGVMPRSITVECGELILTVYLVAEYSLD